MPIPGPSAGYDAALLLDDGTGTFPFDISEYVRAADPLSWNRGRADEQQQNQAGQLTLTLENTDSRFTLGDPTYDVACDQRVRLVYAPGTPSERIRFTGAVQSWPVSWPDGGDEYAVVTATAVDPLASLARKKLKAAVVEEVLLEPGLAALWTMQEKQGLTSAADLTGQAPDLTIISGAPSAAPAPTWGTDLGDPAGSTSALFVSDPTAVAPQFLGCSYAQVLPSLHLEVAFLSGVTNGNSGQLASLLGPLSNATLALVGIAGGQVQVRAQPGNGVPVTVATVDNAQLHVLAMEVDATSVHVILDGQVVYTGAGVAGTFDLSQFTVGAALSGTASTMQIAYVNVGTRLSDARVISHQLGLLQDFTGETVAERVARLASYNASPVGTLSTAGSTTLGPVAQGGRSALEVIQEAADADQGSAYADAAGEVSYASGFDLAATVVPAYSGDAEFVDESATFEVDLQSVVNVATGKAVSSDRVFDVYAEASRLAHGDYPQDYSWNVETDEQALSRTQWKVNVYAEPLPRCPTLKIDLLTMDDLALRELALDLELGAVLEVTGLPAQTPGGSTAQLVVQGIKETVQTAGSDGAWYLELNTAQRSLWDAAIWDDAVYGLWDSPTARWFI